MIFHYYNIFLLMCFQDKHQFRCKGTKKNVYTQENVAFGIIFAVNYSI